MRVRKPVRRAVPGSAARWGLVLVILSMPCAAYGAGFVRDDDFIVFAPDESLAEAVLAKAAQLRRQIAEEWFGEPLPPGAGRTLIHVQLDDREDSGLTWP